MDHGHARRQSRGACQSTMNAGGIMKVKFVGIDNHSPRQQT